jgi:hypothetical protein
MRVLVALNVLQLALITYLIAAGNPEDSGREREMQTDGGPEVAGAPLSAQSRDADDARLRQIIREELRYLTAAIREEAQESAQLAETAALAPVEDAQAGLYQREIVDQQIEYYRSQGTISDSEMAALENEIAKLNSSDRQPMLSKLIRAMNAGEIHGKLL